MSQEIMDIKKLEDTIKKYLNKKEQELVLKAYQEANQWHKGEKRQSGESYITHPIYVAYYLAQEQLDAPTVAAALLHDVVENTPQTKEDVEKKFGKEVATLVDGVTKLNKIKIKQTWQFPSFINKITGVEYRLFEQHVDNLRKMLLAMTKDVRVILIKLADRLHNMQTLKYMPPSRQQEIAQETLEIYAPIAYRLGMGELKGTLEDLAFPYIHPKEYKKIKEVSSKLYPKKENYIEKFKKILNKLLKTNEIENFEIHGRKKHLYSLWLKMQRYGNDISKIYDLVAIRVIVPDIESCYKVLGIIHKNYRPLIGRIKDYIAVAKPNGYRSLHTTVFGPEGEIIEVQIRTWDMHKQAELGVAAHWQYSSQKRLSKDYKKLHVPSQQIDWLEELAKWHEKITDPKEWEKGLMMDFFKKQIFVFTPRGDIINLPANSTPIDFAYSIHSEVGKTCIGAKVNGIIEKLSTSLNNGDIVEIITDKKQVPKKDWLNIVKSNKAKTQIKIFFNKK